MQKFLIRSLFLILLFSATESWALPECKRGLLGLGLNTLSAMSGRAIKYHNCEGTHTYADGGKYVGEWKDDKYHGQGPYTFPRGAKYVGEYKDGMQHGQGTNTSANGDKYFGKWADGKPHGQGTFTSVDGRKCVGEFKDDKTAH